MIRLYRNYDPATSSSDVQMVSAFRGLGEIISVRRGSGVIVDWKQAGGFLLVGGDSRIIRVWDAHTEAQLLVRGYSTFKLEAGIMSYPQDLETNSDSPVTAIASERGPSSVLLASFADGIIKVFDRRLEEEDAVVRSFNEHTNWVQNVRWQPHFGNQFLSARFVSVLLQLLDAV
jgi:regulator-associated protein of mTOR